MGLFSAWISGPARSRVRESGPPPAARAATGTRQVRWPVADAGSSTKRRSVSSTAEPVFWPAITSTCTSGTPSCSVKSWATLSTSLPAAAACTARHRSTRVALP